MKKLVLLTLMFVLGAFSLQAQQQEPKETTTVISLDKYCCDDSNPLIEKVLAYESGVKSFKLNPEQKNVEVVYKTKSTNPEKIAKSLAKAGFEANGVEADKRAIEKLPKCCKNTAKGQSSGCGGGH